MAASINFESSLMRSHVSWVLQATKTLLNLTARQSTRPLLDKLRPLTRLTTRDVIYLILSGTKISVYKMELIILVPYKNSSTEYLPQVQIVYPKGIKGRG